jgi:hypothetical protein
MYTGLFAGLVGAKNATKTGIIKPIVANLMPDELPVSMPVRTRFAGGYDHPHHRRPDAAVRWMTGFPLGR